MIRVFRSKAANCYMVDFDESPQRDEIQALFGTIQIPSPFSVNADPGTVTAEIAKRQEEEVSYCREMNR